MKDKTIGFIGTGMMGEALIKGITKAGLVERSKICASDIDKKKLDLMHEELGIAVSTDNRVVLEQADTIILAIKPQIIRHVLQGIRDSVSKKHLFISIAAGVSTGNLADDLPDGTRIVRVMPNICATVGEAASAICPGSAADDSDVETARWILNAVGRTVVVEEHLMDAVTGLSGSGPAFVSVVIRALADGGVHQGLDRATARTLAAQTVLGTARMVLDLGLHPAELRDMVSSPAGTTIHGIEALEKGQVRAGIMSAVIAASMRSNELGK
ncbi:MAG: pyrroline-5-carboxylate reductase [Methanosarcinales archaeon]|nr:pyrroline-5-carboxylate reductase [Methanosarcinales archaeon]